MSIETKEEIEKWPSDRAMTISVMICESIVKDGQRVTAEHYRVSSSLLQNERQQLLGYHLPYQQGKHRNVSKSQHYESEETA